MIRLHSLHDSYADILDEGDIDLLHSYLDQERIKEPHDLRIGEGFKLRTVYDLNERVSPLRFLALILHDHCQEMIEKFYNTRLESFSPSILSHDLCLEKTEIHVTEIDQYGYTPLRTANFNLNTSNRCFVVRYVLSNPKGRKMSVHSENTHEIDQPENSVCIFPASPLFQYAERPDNGEFKFIDFYLSYADRE